MAETLGEEYMRTLREIYDDDDFLLGMRVHAKDDRVKNEILRYIMTLRLRGEAVNPDDLILLSIALRDKNK